MVTAMYNSSHPHDLDDADITMINPSLLYDASDDQINTFIPIARRQQQANQGATASAKAVHSSSYQTPLNDRFDYGLIDRDRQEAAQQVEQILHQYHRELEQDSIPQMDCHRQLMTRLIDFLRPTYSSNRSKMDDLDLLFEKITTVYEKRQIEVQQRSEQRGQEICYLKKLILTSSPEDQQLERINRIISYEEWMEVEDETRKLQDLVEDQRLRIRELSQLLLQETSVSSYTPVATSDPVIFVPKPDITQRPKVPIPTGEGRPASKARPIDSGTTTADAALTFHSLTDLLGRSLEETVNITGADESRTVKPTSVARQPSRTLPDDNTKRCPVCDEIFPSRATEDEIVYHIEICSSSGARQASTVEKDERYDCPICEQKAVATDEGSYHDHLVRCSNANNIQF